MALVSDDLRKTIFQHALGPRGGLFMIGMLIGAVCMYFFMASTFIAALNDRVAHLEKENDRIHEKLEVIALERLHE